jgi:hypothetical protein
MKIELTEQHLANLVDNLAESKRGREALYDLHNLFNGGAVGLDSERGRKSLHKLHKLFKDGAVGLDTQNRRAIRILFVAGLTEWTDSVSGLLQPYDELEG